MAEKSFSLLRKGPVLIAFLSIFLSSCGSGGSGAPSVSSAINGALNSSPIVDAGHDAIWPASSGGVTLNGIATDSDGYIASYHWEQTSGEPVEIIGPENSKATFNAPPTGGDLTFRLTVTDDQGAAATDSVTIYINDFKVGVSGHVTFDLVPFQTTNVGLDYNNIGQFPARGVVVEVLDEDGYVLTSLTTDDAGFFSARVKLNTLVQIRILAKLLYSANTVWEVKVTDNTESDALYAAQGDVFNSGEIDSIHNLNMPSGWTGTNYSSTRVAAPFAVLDTIYDVLQKFALIDSSIELPPLEIHWSEKNGPAVGLLSEGDIGSSFYSSDGKIYLLGMADTDSDEYDRHVIIHEWGHYFEDKLSRTNSRGGSHSVTDRLDMRVAFSEGWSNALSGMITDDSLYRDSSGTSQNSGFFIDIEKHILSPKGWFNEGSVHSIIYNIYDSNNEGDDSIALGLGPIVKSMMGSDFINSHYFASIFLFVDLLKTTKPSASKQIDDLLAGQSIFGTHANGENEINSGQITTVLPVYKLASVSGSSVQACSTNSVGHYNKLGVTSFIEFDVPFVGWYKVGATEVGNSTNSDPDFIIHRSGSITHVSESYTIGSEISDLFFSETGTHVVELYDWNNIDDTTSAGKYCFDFQISS